MASDEEITSSLLGGATESNGGESVTMSDGNSAQGGVQSGPASHVDLAVVGRSLSLAAAAATAASSTSMRGHVTNITQIVDVLDAGEEDSNEDEDGLALVQEDEGAAEEEEEEDIEEEDEVEEEERTPELNISNLMSGEEETDFLDSDEEEWIGRSRAGLGSEKKGTLPKRSTKRKRFPSVLETRNVLRKLRLREVYRRGNYAFRRNNDKDKFRNLKLLHELDTHDGDASRYQLSFLRRRSKIIEIVAHKGAIFALTATGVCAAFDRDSRRRL